MPPPTAITAVFLIMSFSSSFLFCFQHFSSLVFSLASTSGSLVLYFLLGFLNFALCSLTTGTKRPMISSSSSSFKLSRNSSNCSSDMRLISSKSLSSTLLAHTSSHRISRCSLSFLTLNSLCVSQVQLLSSFLWFRLECIHVFSTSFAAPPTALVPMISFFFLPCPYLFHASSHLHSFSYHRDCDASLTL